MRWKGALFQFVVLAKGESDKNNIYIYSYMLFLSAWKKQHSWVLSGTKLAHRCTKNACHGGLMGCFC